MAKKKDKKIPSSKEIKKLLLETIQVLEYQSIRADKDALSDSELLKLLCDTRDSAVHKLQKCVLTDTFEGSGALTTVIERLEKQITLLDDTKCTRNKTMTITWQNE